MDVLLLLLRQLIDEAFLAAQTSKRMARRRGSWSLPYKLRSSKHVTSHPKRRCWLPCLGRPHWRRCQPLHPCESVASACHPHGSCRMAFPVSFPIFGFVLAVLAAFALSGSSSGTSGSAWVTRSWPRRMAHGTPCLGDPLGRPRPRLAILPHHGGGAVRHRRGWRGRGRGHGVRLHVLWPMWSTKRPSKAAEGIGIFPSFFI